MSPVDVALQLAFWGPIVLFSIGIPSAVFNIIIFTDTKTLRESPVSYYIIGQSIGDASTLLILLLQIIPATSVSISTISCKLTYYFAQTTVPWAMTFLCLVAFDRWACTSQSVRIRQMSSVRVARCLFLISFILWPLVNIPFLIYSDLTPSTLVCWFTNDLFALIVTYFLAPFLFTIIPLIVLCIFSILTYRNIHHINFIRQRHILTRQIKQEQQLARLTIIQTFFSILCTFPRAIFLLYWLTTIVENIPKNSDRLSIELLLNQLSVFIISLNYTSSFYIFLISSSRFRRNAQQRLRHLCKWRVRRVNVMVNVPERPRADIHRITACVTNRRLQG